MPIRPRTMLALLAALAAIGCDDDGGTSTPRDTVIVLPDDIVVLDTGQPDATADASDASADGTATDTDAPDTIPPQPAIDALEIVPSSTDLPGGGAVGCVTASCPAGKSLVGGGGNWGEAIEIVSSQPLLDSNAWELCGVSDAPAPLEVEARCAVLRDDVSLEVVASSGDWDELSGDCHVTACPGNSLAIAGGGQWSSTFAHDATRLESGGWLVCGFAETAQSVAVSALCATGLQSVARFEEAMGAGPTCTQVGCAPGEVLTSGGGAWGGQAGVTGYRGEADQWALCTAPIADTNWTSYAVCVR